jgi:hypothetical protein
MEKQFKVGDKVRMVKSIYPENIGAVGEIVGFKEDLPGWCGVRWERPMRSHNRITGIQSVEFTTSSAATFHQLEIVSEELHLDWERIAPKTVLDLVSTQQSLTNTKLGSKFEHQCFIEEAERLDQTFDRSLVKTFIFLTLLAVGCFVSGLAFIELSQASNELVETIREGE